MGIEVKKCTIISGAPNNDIDFLENNIDKESYIICADSGYKNCLKLNIVPNLIIGDFDSAEYPNIDCEIVKLQREKAYTDTFHCVIEAVERGYDYIEIYCCIGDRIDHTYANILCLDYCQKHNVKCYIIDKKNRVSLISKSGIIPKEYENFSLFAYLEDCLGVKIKGAYYTAGFYNKDSIDIKLGTQIGVSNYVVDDYAEVSLDSGTLLLIESND